MRFIEPQAVDFDRAFSFTGKELRSLLRVNRMTIRGLSEKMQITLKSIRHKLNHGTSGHSECEYYEAITGSLSPRMQAAYRQNARIGDDCLV